MPTGAIRLHRVLRTNPERVYRAFLDAAALAKWLPPYGFTCQVHQMEARIGGTYRMSFTNFTTGQGHSFGGAYRELLPFERIRYTDSFDDPYLPGEMQTTITLLSRLAAVAGTTCPSRRARYSFVTRHRLARAPTDDLTRQ
jgi:uncharacterized protein YndB with AHSA1/START domain